MMNLPMIWRSEVRSLRPRMGNAAGCLLLLCMSLVAPASSNAQDNGSGLPGFLRRLFGTSSNSERAYTPAEAPLQIARTHVLLNITNAYNPEGIRYLAIQLRFRNHGMDEVTIHTKASRLQVGQEELLRVQVRDELQSMPINLTGESSDDVEVIQGTGTLMVPTNGRPKDVWLVFAKLPRTRDLPSMTLKLETSNGKIELDLTRIENEGLTSQLGRLGPSGRVGIARVAGELNVVNAPHFTQMIQQYAEQGVSRLVVSFQSQSRIGDETTSEWLIEGWDDDNDRLQFYPQWSGLMRDVVFVNVPNHDDETQSNLTLSEADAVQRVTRDLISSLDPATLHREFRSGHPLFRRAILLNAGDAIANDDCELVLGYLKSQEPVFSEPAVRQAAIQSLRAALAPEGITALEEIVRQGSKTDAALALRSLNESQQTQGRTLAIQLATDPGIQSKIGLADIIRSVGVTGDERWMPLLRSAWQSPDPSVRDIALQQLLQMETEDRLTILETALADKQASIRERAFSAMVPQRSADEHPLFVKVALKRIRAGLHDENTLVALREIRDPTVLPQLLKWIDENPTGSHSLVKAYVGIGGPEALERMIDRYPSFEAESRDLLFRALMRARHPSARKLAVEGLLSDDNAYHVLCQSWLAELADDEAIAALAAAIEKTSESDTNRGEELARVLGSIGSQRAMQVLESFRTSTNIAQRRIAEAGINYQALTSTSNFWLQAASNKTQEGDFEGAIQLLKIALEVDTESGPSAGRIYNSMGFATLGLGKGDLGKAKEASAYFENARSRLPDDHNPLTGVAICKAIEGRYEEAIQMVDTPLLNAKYENNDTYLYNVACVYGRSLEQLLKEPDSPERSEKAKTYRERALSFLNNAIRNGFENSTLLTNDVDLTSLHDLAEFQELSKKITDQMRN